MNQDTITTTDKKTDHKEKTVSFCVKF